MSSLAVYLVKVAVLSAFFWLFYKVALARSTFFRLNRAILLLSVCFSLGLSAWQFTYVSIRPHPAVPNSIFVEAVDFVEEKTAAAVGRTGAESTDVSSKMLNDSNIAPPAQYDTSFYVALLLILIYFGGAAFVLLRQLAGHLQILRLMHGAQSAESIASAEGMDPSRFKKVYIINKKILPFSWLGCTFMDVEDFLTGAEAVLAHEREHIRQGHFLDLLIINVFVALQWFNPFAWLLKRELINVHEYQADGGVTKCGINAKQYQYLLIAKAAQRISLPVGNHLLSGNLEKRIIMMQKKKSKRIVAMRALLMIPLVFVSVIIFAQANNIAQNTIGLKVGMVHNQLFTYPMTISDYDIQDSSDFVITYLHRYSVADYSDGKKMIEDKMDLQVGKSVAKFYSSNLHILDARKSGDKSRRVPIRTDYIGYEIFTYADRAEMTVTNREFFSTENVFRYEENMPKLRWQISSDTLSVIGYRCNKAETTFRGRSWTVWYSTDIPASVGPWKLQGLPGAILKAEDSSGEYCFEAIGIMKEKQAICMYKWPYSDISYKKWKKYDKSLHANPSFYSERAGIAGFVDATTNKDLDETWSIPYNPIEY